MVRKMNRISLYEAIRRQKEKQGLNPPPKTGTTPGPEQRNEASVHLKQLPVPAKPSVPVKPAVKSPVKTPLSVKKPFLRKEPKNSWQFSAFIRNFIKDNPATTWIGIGGVVILLLLVVFLLNIQPGHSESEPTGQTGGGINQAPPVSANEQQKTQNQMSVVPKAQEKKPAEKPVAAEKPAETPKVQLPAPIKEELQKKAESEKTQPPKPASAGDHIIVIATYTKQEHLVPVEAYFRQNGIETEVVKLGSYYQLVTKQRFENPERSGTDGYKIKQAIKRIGAGYKAPDGYERFSSTPFQDVYGKKVK